MKLENRELITEFFERHKEEFPTLSEEDFKEIIFSPWRFLKKEMEGGELPTVRFKYFGTFQVYPGRARNMLANIKMRFKVHKIDRKQYFELKEMLEKYLDKYEQEIKS